MEKMQWKVEFVLFPQLDKTYIYETTFLSFYNNQNAVLSKTNYIIKWNNFYIRHTFSSFKVLLRQFTINVNDEEAQIMSGLRLSIEQMVSTDPCLEHQLDDEADFDSSSSTSTTCPSSRYCRIIKCRINHNKSHSFRSMRLPQNQSNKKIKPYIKKFG